MKSLNAAKQSGSSYTRSNSPNSNPTSNQPLSVWRGLLLHKKMAEMESPICDYRAPSGGGWMERTKNQKQQQDSLWMSTYCMFYGLTKTNTLLHFFSLPNTVPLRISQKIKIENKNLCYSSLFYYNISQILHLYKHL